MAERATREGMRTRIAVGPRSDVPPELVGREVSVRAVLPPWEAAIAKGVSPERLAEGTGYSPAHLTDVRERISWAAFVRVLANVRSVMTDAELIALGAAALDKPVFRTLLLPARLLFDIVDVYLWLLGPSGPGAQLFLTFEGEIERNDPGRLTIDLRMKPGYAPSRENFLLLEGSLSGLSSAFGVGPARVVFHPTKNGARYDVEVTPTKGALSFVKRKAAWLTSARAAAEELIRANTELHDRYVELKRESDARIRAEEELRRINAELETTLAEERKAKHALERSEARFRKLFDAGILGIVISDPQGNIHEANDAFLKIIGYSREDLAAGLLHASRLNTADRDRTDAAPRKQLSAAGRAGPWEKVIVGKDGRVIPIMNGVAVLDESPPVYVSFVLDLTELKAAEARAAEAEMLRRAKESAEEAYAELETFSYSVAHDLRAPLRGIAGNAAAILEDYEAALDAAGKQHLARIGAGVQQMSEVIDALLGLARITRADVRRERIDLAELARAYVAHLRAHEPQRSVEFIAPESVVAFGDAKLLRVLLDNLLGNAWKFTRNREDAHIEFGIEDVSGVATYFVRDNGAGFDMNLSSKLFAPFRRLHTTREFEGTGIGLATVQRIVRRHGGKVWAESAVDRGATFRFTLERPATTTLSSPPPN